MREPEWHSLTAENRAVREDHVDAGCGAADRGKPDAERNLDPLKMDTLNTSGHISRIRANITVAVLGSSSGRAMSVSMTRRQL
jgi:hypothetical protein